MKSLKRVVRHLAMGTYVMWFCKIQWAYCRKNADIIEFLDWKEKLLTSLMYAMHCHRESNPFHGAKINWNCMVCLAIYNYYIPMWATPPPPPHKLIWAKQMPVQIQAYWRHTNICKEAALMEHNRSTSATSTKLKTLISSVALAFKKHMLIVKHSAPYFSWWKSPDKNRIIFFINDGVYFATW